VLRQAPAIAALLVAVASAASAGDRKTYRSEQFGYELSYPAELDLRVWFGGASGELRDPASGDAIATLDVWPADLCPRERPGTTAKGLGVERAVAVTQADGDDGSSSCGKPVALRELTSRRHVRLYELELTCRGEHRVGRTLVRERLGKKGPTFFADISPPWRSRVLMIDPVGADPRMDRRRPSDLGIVRQVLETLTTFAVPDSHVVCIDDLPPGTPAAAGR